MKLDILNQMFYNNYKRKLIKEGLDKFGSMENDEPIDVITILDEYFEQNEKRKEK